MIILERLLPDSAVIWEDGGEISVPLSSVRGSAEGDVLIRQDGIFVTDNAATEKRRKDIIKLQDSLWDE